MNFSLAAQVKSPERSEREGEIPTDESVHEDEYIDVIQLDDDKSENLVICNTPKTKTLLKKKKTRDHSPTKDVADMPMDILLKPFQEGIVFRSLSLCHPGFSPRPAMEALFGRNKSSRLLPDD